MTPATLRTLIAASDGSDQGEILNAAFDVLLPDPYNNPDARIQDPEWSDISAEFAAFTESIGYIEAAVIIAQALLPGCDYMAGTVQGGQGGGCIMRLADGRQLSSETLITGTPALAILDATCAAIDQATP